MSRSRRLFVPAGLLRAIVVDFGDQTPGRLADRARFLAFDKDTKARRRVYRAAQLPRSQARQRSARLFARGRARAVICACQASRSARARRRFHRARGPAIALAAAHRTAGSRSRRAPGSQRLPGSGSIVSVSGDMTTPSRAQQRHLGRVRVGCLGLVLVAPAQVELTMHAIRDATTRQTHRARFVAPQRPLRVGLVAHVAVRRECARPPSSRPRSRRSRQRNAWATWRGRAVVLGVVNAGHSLRHRRAHVALWATGTRSPAATSAAISAKISRCCLPQPRGRVARRSSSPAWADRDCVVHRRGSSRARPAPSTIAHLPGPVPARLVARGVSRLNWILDHRAGRPRLALTRSSSRARLLRSSRSNPSSFDPSGPVIDLAGTEPTMILWVAIVSLLAAASLAAVME